MDIFSHNGVIKPKAEATVSLFSIEFTYGFGVYETLRVTKNGPKYAEQHAERLLQSASIIGLEHPFSKKDIQTYVADLAAQLGKEAFNIKILLLGGKTAEDTQMYMLPIRPRFPDRQLYKQGAHTITLKHERYLPQAKTLNMLPSYIAYRKARKAGAYDAILLNSDNEMLEGTMTNLFAIKGMTLYTTPEKYVLTGVTRTNIIACALANGYSLEEKLITIDEISDYDGFFISSTSTKIMPLKSIDDRLLDIPDELVQLMTYFKEIS